MSSRLEHGGRARQGWRGRSRPIDVGNLAACTEDVRAAALEGEPGPADPTDHPSLLARLRAARQELPPLYREAVLRPFLSALESLGPAGFARVLAADPLRRRAAGLVLDVAQAILQNAERYDAEATDAFQEVVSDLYDGFLGAEDRRGVKPPDRGVIAPMVKWGGADSGPYAWTALATSNVGAKAAIVSLPPANARRGLLAWSALAHETAGHDILDADAGLKGELAGAVWSALIASQLPGALADYWSDRIGETASDVMGILNMGPAAGIGLIGYLRGMRAAQDGVAALASLGPAADPHPADILRGYLAAATVELLGFSDAAAWARILEDETTKDLATIGLEGVGADEEQARRSARIVARVLVRRKATNLENHALGEIQDWRDADEAIVAQVRAPLESPGPAPERLVPGTCAAHVTAAAVASALSAGARIEPIFRRMRSLLKRVHDENPSWGPLHVAHSGDLVRDFACVRLRAREGAEETRSART